MVSTLFGEGVAHVKSAAKANGLRNQGRAFHVQPAELGRVRTAEIAREESQVEGVTEINEIPDQTRRDQLG